MLMKPDRPLRLRLMVPLSLVLLVTLVGTFGYIWLGREHHTTLLDALFMTVITITTIGYGEVVPLDDAGRIFTMAVALTGIGSLFYSFGVLMESLLTSRLIDPLGERKMQREIDKLKDHVIVAGLGRVGRQAVDELRSSQVPVVTIDPGPEAANVARQHGYLFIGGDATQDEVLKQAGIERAKGLVVTTGDDANNMYIVLSARTLSASLYIVSRAVTEATIPKLIRAGANRAISPYAIGGRRLAHLILSPTVVDFFDTVIRRGDESLNLEGVRVDNSAAAVGKSIAELQLRERSGASVLVVLRGASVLPNPASDLVVQAGDELLALGTAEQLDRLEQLVAQGAG
jgi:voltage-gated potassium channel